MHTHTHALLPPTPGTHRELISLHYGQPGAAAGKAYLQASLHADELPGMLVAHHLRRRLDALEAEDRITGEIVLVPMANPIGLSQHLLHGTSLASIVTIMDLTGAARQVNSSYYIPFEAFITAAIFYFLLTLALVGLFHAAERRWLKPLMPR